MKLTKGVTGTIRLKSFKSIKVEKYIDNILCMLGKPNGIRQPLIFNSYNYEHV